MPLKVLPSIDSGRVDVHGLGYEVRTHPELYELQRKFLQLGVCVINWRSLRTGGHYPSVRRGLPAGVPTSHHPM